MNNKTHEPLSRETNLTREALTARTLALRSQGEGVNEEGVDTAKLTADAWVHANSLLASVSAKSAVNDAEYAAFASVPNSDFKKIAIATLESRINQLGQNARTEYLEDAEKRVSDRMTAGLEPFEGPVLAVLKKMNAQASATHG